jgi:CheY-like chemotaxis protein
MGKKILLADDSITIQKVIELTFSDEDFEVVTVGNGRLAIEKVQDVRPDVVLCDIIMPEKDGYEVCDFVKKNAALSHIPVLLLTGAFEPFDQERASRVGCDGFLAKPFEPQALIAKVKDLLRQAEARQPATAPVPAVAPPPPPAPVAAAAEPEPSPSATVWAAPSPVVSPVWEAPVPQTRPIWTPPAAATPAPEPVAGESGVHFIPEDPFAEESAGFGASSGETMRVPTFPEEPYGNTPEVEPEPYVLDPAAAPPEELLPMTPDEEQSLAPEPLSWEAPPAAAPAPEPAVAAAPSERDLFLEEVFDEAAAAVEAAHAAHAASAAEPEPEPAPAAAASPGLEPHPVRIDEPVTDFAAVARDAFSSPADPMGSVSPEAALPPLEPEPEPEPAPEPPPIAAPEPPIVAAPPPAPEPMPPAPLRTPEPAAGTFAEDRPVMAPAAATEDLELEAEESFASVAPPAPEPVAPPPSEAAAVQVPMDMVSQIAQRVVAQISEKVIREIAWEVIPDMAEALIKREIERLTAELQRG